MTKFERNVNYIHSFFHYFYEYYSYEDRIWDVGLIIEDPNNKMGIIKLDLKKKRSQLNRLTEEAVRQRKCHAIMKYTLQEIMDDALNLAS